MRGLTGLQANIDGEIISVVSVEPKLKEVTRFYKRKNGRIVECTIKEYPRDAWSKVVNYARLLREKYGKKVDLAVIVTSNGKYLRFEREDGVPIYIREDGRIFVKKRYRISEITVANVGIWYLVDTCGYRITTKLTNKRARKVPERTTSPS